MGCETKGPGTEIPNNPFALDHPKLSRWKQGQGPCRLTRSWKEKYQGDWPDDTCDTVASGVNPLCFYVKHRNAFKGKANSGNRKPNFPWYQDVDNGCLPKCLADKNKLLAG